MYFVFTFEVMVDAWTSCFKFIRWYCSFHSLYTWGYLSSSTRETNCSASKSKPLVCAFYKYMTKLAHRCEEIGHYLISMDPRSTIVYARSKCIQIYMNELWNLNLSLQRGFDCTIVEPTLPKKRAWKYLVPLIIRINWMDLWEMIPLGNSS